MGRKRAQARPPKVVLGHEDHIVLAAACLQNAGRLVTPLGDILKEEGERGRVTPGAPAQQSQDEQQPQHR